jgi:hypothetical protein
MFSRRCWRDGDAAPLARRCCCWWRGYFAAGPSCPTGLKRRSPQHDHRQSFSRPDGDTAEGRWQEFPDRILDIGLAPIRESSAAGIGQDILAKNESRGRGLDVGAQRSFCNPLGSDLGLPGWRSSYGCISLACLARLQGPLSGYAGPPDSGVARFDASRRGRASRPWSRSRLRPFSTRSPYQFYFLFDRRPRPSHFKRAYVTESAGDGGRPGRGASIMSVAGDRGTRARGRLRWGALGCGRGRRRAGTGDEHRADAALRRGTESQVMTLWASARSEPVRTSDIRLSPALGPVREGARRTGRFRLTEYRSGSFLQRGTAVAQTGNVSRVTSDGAVIQIVSRPTAFTENEFAVPPARMAGTPGGHRRSIRGLRPDQPGLPMQRLVQRSCVPSRPIV